MTPEKKAGSATYMGRLFNAFTGLTRKGGYRLLLFRCAGVEKKEDFLDIGERVTQCVPVDFLGALRLVRRRVPFPCY